MSSQPPQEPSLGQIKAPPTQNHVRLWRLARNSQYGHLRGWNFQEGQFCTSVATLLFCPNALVKCVLMCFACFCVVITCHVLPCAVALVVCKQYFHKSYERCSYQKKNREMYLYIYICVCVCVNVSVYVSMRLYVMFLTVYYKIFGSISIIEKKIVQASSLPAQPQAESSVPGKDNHTY